jgi:hypothetical protein
MRAGRAAVAGLVAALLIPMLAFAADSAGSGYAAATPERT